MQLREIRRTLHRIPEESGKEWKTKEFLWSVLKPMHCQLVEVLDTGIAAFFDFHKPYTLAFRCELDALAIQEQTQHDYISKHPGFMHACGHDGHMAMILKLAEILNHSQEDYPYNVLLLFQPSEEKDGGAEKIVQLQVLELFRVKAIFAFHLYPGSPAGSIYSIPGPMMPRTHELKVDIYGKSSHVAQYEQGINALTAGAEWIMRMKELSESWNFNHLLQFGIMNSGTANNILSNHTFLYGTLRSYNELEDTLMTRAIKETANALMKTSGTSIDVFLSTGYPAVINDTELFAQTIKALKEYPLHQLEKPLRIGEDFSFYQQVIPGCFMLLSTGNLTSLHADTFDFDETVLETGVQAYLTILKEIQL